jgi:hypothetical protein
MSVTSDAVNVPLVYSVPPTDGTKPFQTINIDPKTRVRERNYSQELHPTDIENILGKEDSVTLDTAGFQFYNSPTKHKAFDNDEDIQAEYYPESIELLKKLTGASRVVLFDHSELTPLTPH